jgi:hypothetical protein
VDVVLRDGRLGMNINGRLFERPLVRDLVDDRNGEAEARQRRVRKLPEALDLPFFSLRHHQQDGVPVAAVAADADVAGRAVSRGAERALPRGLGQASSGHGGGCALLSRGLEESTRGHRGERRAGGPRGVSCQRARCLACEGLHRVHHHGRIVGCACACGAVSV